MTSPSFSGPCIPAVLAATSVRKYRSRRVEFGAGEHSNPNRCSLAVWSPTRRMGANEGGRAGSPVVRDHSP
jgi:hypothetical protein